MKLFKIWQTVNEDYDTYDSAVVASENEDEARRISPDVHHEWDESAGCWVYIYGDGSKVKAIGTWARKDDVKVKYIGEAKEGTEKGVILASFNAG